MDLPPIDDIFEIVRSSTDAVRGWHRLRTLCADRRPSRLWDRLSVIDPQNDVKLASAWLCGQLQDPNAPRSTRGIFLGLDTSNMDDGLGHNVEIAVSSAVDPFSFNLDWLWKCEWYGEKHLIGGLLGMRRVYGERRWEGLFDFAEYTLVLGYGGLVLADALGGADLDEPFLAVWGFHDGDLFVLGQGDGRGFVRLASTGIDEMIDGGQSMDGPRLRIWDGSD